MHSPSSKLEGFTSSENCHLPSPFLSCELPHIQCGLNAVESQYGLCEKDSSRLINPAFFALLVLYCCRSEYHQVSSAYGPLKKEPNNHVLM